MPGLLLIRVLPSFFPQLVTRPAGAVAAGAAAAGAAAAGAAAAGATAAGMASTTQAASAANRAISRVIAAIGISIFLDL